MRTSLRTLPPPDPFSRQPAPTVISLGQVRSRPRTSNEYVESPRAQPSLPLKSQHITSLVGGGGGGSGGGSPGFAHRVVPPSRVGVGIGSNNCVVGGGGGGGSPRSNLLIGSGHNNSTSTSLTSPSSPVISLQPLSKPSPLKKESVALLDGSVVGDGHRNLGSDGGGGGFGIGQSRDTATNGAGGQGPSFAAGAAAPHGASDRIMCDQCGKCQCAACTEPRPLPSHWCCRDKCEVSPDKVLDVCTCFCCIKCTFYHCGTEEDENECYEQPCGCGATPHCCQRWAVISLMALCLPCLWTYWPARGCLACCRHCYNCSRLRKGCHCQQNGSRHPKKSSVLSGGGDGGGSGGGIVGGGGGSLGGSASVGVGVGGGGSTGGGNSKHSQTRRLLIESDSSSA
ncbi:protein sprouty homolog 3 [Aplysia californica]|uniref:Protein sprouty homolog 3 n=1 Tax=Aplysia californica TaxID=6500 RepID=A0ABM0JVG7_APLCA|nr:protein sprouty homolog 3 [Aplysia californica]XP_005102499.1 protein sprouty homolog 3 [Aplysia californica]XP_012940338.1 protein sprouty homolog 3 [Aplysia californica]XP_035826719.1 protein sprouty homolog 3 [Aplysia californica]XP_035826720.1 protein sprouty homolog 3 [Aplysia californica]